MEYSGLPSQAAHHILLEGREELTVSGVEEVESFDENTIVMLTVKGTLVVRGEDLHIEKLSLDGGDLKVEGTVDSLSYEDAGRERVGRFCFWRRAAICPAACSTSARKAVADRRRAPWPRIIICSA